MERWEGVAHTSPLSWNGKSFQHKFVTVNKRERTKVRRKRLDARERNSWFGECMLPPRLTVPRHRAKATRPTIRYRTTIYLIQRQHGAARSPLYPMEASSSTKQSQERVEPNRANTGRSASGFTPLGTRPQNTTLDLANFCSFDLTKPGV